MWMRKTFGCANPNIAIEYLNANAIHITKQQAGTNGANIPGLIGNAQGIYSMVWNSATYSGHADILYSNQTCDNGCYFNKSNLVYLDIWQLQ
ncbi:MAG: hypothetical protein IPQ27_04045 [Chitinophagaceae bacterium]|nr:hypothetical protein [Chitinophagaceae bacterium]